MALSISWRIAWAVAAFIGAPQKKHRHEVQAHGGLDCPGVRHVCQSQDEYWLGFLTWSRLVLRESTAEIHTQSPNFKASTRSGKYGAGLPVERCEQYTTSHTGLRVLTPFGIGETRLSGRFLLHLVCGCQPFLFAFRFVGEDRVRGFRGSGRGKLDFLSAFNFFGMKFGRRPVVIDYRLRECDQVAKMFGNRHASFSGAPIGVGVEIGWNAERCVSRPPGGLKCFNHGRIVFGVFAFVKENAPTWQRVRCLPEGSNTLARAKRVPFLSSVERLCQVEICGSDGHEWRDRVTDQAGIIVVHVLGWKCADAAGDFSGNHKGGNRIAVVADEPCGVDCFAKGKSDSEPKVRDDWLVERENCNSSVGGIRPDER